ncbi:MAG: DUF4238 domain-containing protein [Pseudomonadota bacterium]
MSALGVRERGKRTENFWSIANFCIPWIVNQYVRASRRSFLGSKFVPNPPRRHHYVPEFLLKRWASEDGKVVRFKRVRGDKLHAKRVPFQGIGFQENLYALPNMDPKKPITQVLETHFFSPIDNAGAQCLDTLENATDIPADKRFRTDWAAFLLSLSLRGPTAINNLHELAAHLIEEESREGPIEEKTERIVQENPEFAEAVRQPIENFNSRLAMASLPMLVLPQRVLGRIMGLRWFLGTLEGSARELLLSDRPVLWTPLEQPNGSIIFPISPERVFVAARDQQLFEKFSSADPKSLSELINRGTVGCAREFVVARNEKAKKFIEKAFGKLNGAALADAVTSEVYASWKATASKN